MRAPDTRRDKLIYPVAFTVMAVWVASLIYGMVSGDFTPFMTGASPLMLIVGGYAFSTSTIVRSAEKGVRNRD